MEPETIGEILNSLGPWFHWHLPYAITAMIFIGMTVAYRRQRKLNRLRELAKASTTVAELEAVIAELPRGWHIGRMESSTAPPMPPVKPSLPPNTGTRAGNPPAPAGQKPPAPAAPPPKRTDYQAWVDFTLSQVERRLIDGETMDVTHHGSAKEKEMAVSNTTQHEEKCAVFLHGAWHELEVTAIQYDNPLDGIPKMTVEGYVLRGTTDVDVDQAEFWQRMGVSMEEATKAMNDVTAAAAEIAETSEELSDVVDEVIDEQEALERERLRDPRAERDDRPVKRGMFRRVFWALFTAALGGASYEFICWLLFTEKGG